MNKHGITEATPSNVLLGAGVWYKGLEYSGTAWSGTVLGATSGGGEISIVGEYLDLELDGALVKVKGLTVKQGGAATAKINFAEITDDVLKHGTLFEKASTSDVTGFNMYQDKANIVEGDYVENLGFVGFTADGSKQIVVIFENALCTSGMTIAPAPKAKAVVSLTFDAYADNSGDLDRLPVKIYYPTAA